MSYQPPEIAILGSVEDLTLQFNKIGVDPDFITPVAPSIVGVVTSI